MKTTIATAVALAACASTQLFAQTVQKQDIITMSLIGAKQSSVSTSSSVANAGNWSSGPMYYKTTAIKVTDQDVIKYIGAVLWKNASHYSSSAKLVLVQGELSGFFNITPELGQSTANLDSSGNPDGTFTSADGDASTALQNSSDSTTFQLANGRHWDVNPLVTTEYPVGHLQPWGQIYVQDSKTTDDNVTFFFAISVQECYDCFYLNSFISTATFKSSTTAPNGPPCCSLSSVIVGTGKDAYYLTLSFDNTQNNPYLNPNIVDGAAGFASCYVGNHVGIANVNGTPVVGLGSTTIPGDGIVPDTINGAGAQPASYRDAIKSGIGSPSPYEARFTLNGVLTYTWKLAYVDKTDLSPDFLGTGSYVANGYGFIGLYCSLFNSATVTFKESTVKAGTAVSGVDWADDWFGIGAEYVNDSYNGVVTAYQDFIDNGTTYVWGAPVEFPTPINVSTSLAYHQGFDKVYPADTDDFAPAAWPTPSYVKPLFY